MKRGSVPGRREAEFRALFAVEAAERLDRLGEELLQLEAAGAGEDLVASMFREAHSLKGGAAVVGLSDIGQVAHAMEDVLDRLRSGDVAATGLVVDGLLGAVDALRRLVPLAVGGQAIGDEANAITGRLRVLATLPEGVSSIASSVPRLAPVEVPRPIEGPDSRSAEILRVPVQRVDELVRLVGRASTSQLRLGRELGHELGFDLGSLTEFRDLRRVLHELQEEVMRVRMVPVSTVTRVLQRAVRDLSRQTGKLVRWETRGEETELDRSILESLTTPLLHIVRNAVDHGIEDPDERAATGKPREGVIRLHAMQLGSEVVIAVSDDGRGIDVARVREEAQRSGSEVGGLSDEESLFLVFRSGLTTATFLTDVSGRGIGLDAVREAVEGVRGRMELRSEPGTGTEFRISVPITLAVLPCLIVVAAGQRFALPMHFVTTVLPAQVDEVAEGHRLIWLDGRPVPLANLAEALDLAEGSSGGPVVVVSGLTRQHAFEVDGLAGQGELMVKGLGGVVPALKPIAGASIDVDGSILLVLDVTGLIDRARRSVEAGPRRSGESDEVSAENRSVLVVDDALTVRELQRSILEEAGYRVRTATDGAEALRALGEEIADLVLTDVDMPVMDGFELTAAIRADARLSTTPVMILTSRDTDEDRRRGLDAGADAYIVKSAFDAASLIASVERLLGRRA